MSKRPTIQMVAEKAGVSRGTVDRVLNNRSYVNSAVRERVLEAITEIGYIPPRVRYQSQDMNRLEVIKLGVLLPHWEGQFKEDIDKGLSMAKDELAMMGIKVSIKRCKTDISQEAVYLLNELASEKISGLAICALNDDAIQNRVSQFTDSGIPCITFNSDLPKSNRLCFVGQNIHQSGRVAAELISKCVPRDSIILATVGNLKFDGHHQRLAGFIERLSELGFEKSKIITAETFNDYETSFNVVKKAVDTYPDLRGIYMANLNVSGCAEAIRASGKKGSIRVVCHDINESIRQMLLDGSVDFTIPQNMIQQGYLPLILLRDYIRKNSLPDSSRITDQIRVLCAENL